MVCLSELERNFHKYAIGIFSINDYIHTHPIKQLKKYKAIIHTCHIFLYYYIECTYPQIMLCTHVCTHTQTMYPLWAV